MRRRAPRLTRLALAGGAFVFSVFGFLSALRAAVPDRPNVLVIVVETFRADHASCMGYDRKTTPTIDKLASEGILFTNCRSTSSWTAPSHASLFTSLYPSVHGVVDLQAKMLSGCTTIADVLKKHNYSTVAFVSNPCMPARQGFDKGFDFYDDFTVFLDLELNLFGEQDVEHQTANVGETSAKITELAAGWLRRNTNKKFFMFLHYFDPHYDYIPPKPYDTMFDPDYGGDINGRNIVGADSSMKPGMNPRDLEHIVALYDGELSYVDKHVGILLEELKTLGLKDETIIIVTGDHGDEFFDHGGKAHDHTLYRELIHVPLAIRYPPLVPKGNRSGELVSMVDILPTVMEMLDIRADLPIQGRSLAGMLDGTERKKAAPPVYAELDLGAKMKCVIRNNFKLIKNSTDGAEHPWMLFDIENDPGEKRNLFRKKREVANALEHELELLKDAARCLRKLYEAKQNKRVKLDAETRRRLRALGYME